MKPKLIQIIPEHRCYCEVFSSPSALLFAKPPSPVEIYNDTDSDVSNFFRQRRGEVKEVLQEKLTLIPYSPKIIAHQRFQSVQLEKHSTEHLIQTYDGEQTFFYINLIARSLTDNDHRRLLDLIHSIKGKVILNDHRNALYDVALSDWKAIDYEDGALWLNYETDSYLSIDQQYSLPLVFKNLNSYYEKTRANYEAN